MATFGYAGKILKVDLSSRSKAMVTTLDYADRFLGGRGIAARIYWDEVPPNIKACDPENRLLFATGPLAGLPTVGGSRWQVCGKSVATIPEQFSYCNLGGKWGSELKFAGYDALVVHGKSDRPVYLFLHDDQVEIKDASSIWGKGAIKAREILKSELGDQARVVTIGPAGENMVTMANLLADNDSSGSGGLGAVMGSKNLKAIVVRGDRKGIEVARPERFKELMRYYRALGIRLETRVVDIEWSTSGPKTKKDVCFGCTGNCSRITYEAEDGTKGKYTCQSSFFYQQLAKKYYGGWNEVPFLATKLCDDYGIDTMGIDAMMNWLLRCREAGVLTDDETGIPMSKPGSLEFIETLVRKIALREGFGDSMAKGIVKAADSVGFGAREQLSDLLLKIGHEGYYGPRLYITTALLYAMEPRPPMQQIHEIVKPLFKRLNWSRKVEGAYVSPDVLRAIAKRFWGSEEAADFSTYEGKALATKKVQDRQNAKESLILCDRLWPVLDIENPANPVGDPTLESRILSTVIEKEIDEEGLNMIGERVFNLQRAISIREGHRGREDDVLPESWFTMPLHTTHTNPACMVPGKGEEIISRKGAVVDREKFEVMKNEYYGLRQWDVATGLQTMAKLEELDLKDIAEDLGERGLIVGQRKDATF